MTCRDFDLNIRDIILRSRTLKEFSQEQKDISYLMMVIRQKDYEYKKLIEEHKNEQQQR